MARNDWEWTLARGAGAWVAWKLREYHEQVENGDFSTTPPVECTNKHSYPHGTPEHAAVCHSGPVPCPRCTSDRLVALGLPPFRVLVDTTTRESEEWMDRMYSIQPGHVRDVPEYPMLDLPWPPRPIGWENVPTRRTASTNVGAANQTPKRSRRSQA